MIWILNEIPEGIRIDPPMSLPIPSGDIRAAMAAASPPEEPPANLDLSHGFYTLP